jgi:TolB-like protein/tetratricopeptide (TPR) repeat protein
LSAGQTDKYLGVALADALANKFGGLKQITVRPTRAVLKYGENREDAGKIGRELQVDAVLDGRIQRVGEKIRVSVQLIRTADNATIWTESFDDQFTNFFAVQDSISQKVVGALALEIDEADRRKLTVRGTENKQAYQEYLLGRFFWNKRSADDLNRAVEHFNRAVELDVNFAAAYAGLAETYAIYPFFAVVEDKEALPKARAAANRALEIDGELAEAHTALAYVQSQYDFDWRGAEKSYLRAIELNPNQPTTRQWYGEFLAFQNRTDESLLQMQKAIELDPTSLSANAAPALAYNAARRFEKTLEMTDKVLQMDANFLLAQHYRARALFFLGRREEAFELYRKIVAAANGSAYFKADLGCLYGKAGNKTEARRILAELTETAKLKPVSPYYFAIVHIGLGEKEKAFEYLRKAVAEHDNNVIVLKVGANFDSVRDDPQFTEILRSANF